MLRGVRILSLRQQFTCLVHSKTFLTKQYECKDAWTAQISSPILTKVNLNDFYNQLDLSYSSKGMISAIDVDIFANAINDPTYLEELKDLLYKLRLSSETMNTLDSTHHATIRNFIEFGNISELIEILKDPLRFGVFLDDFTANILLNKLITSGEYEQAADVAAIIMLQEEYTHDITCALCQYACYKFISQNKNLQETQKTIETEEKPKKVEEIKIRIPFLRNPYFDDHFDLKDRYLLSGKTLAWMSQKDSDNLSTNLQVIGWLFYKKYNKLLELCVNLSEKKTVLIYQEVLDLINGNLEIAEPDTKAILEKSVCLLNTLNTMDVSLEESLKNCIENAINNTHMKDIKLQEKLFKSWVEIREAKLSEQRERLNRVRRLKEIEEKQKQLKEKEQQLWFFENEEKFDLVIEKKEKLVEQDSDKKSSIQQSDEDYIPPEILPKRR